MIRSPSCCPSHVLPLLLAPGLGGVRRCQGEQDSAPGCRTHNRGLEGDQIYTRENSQAEPIQSFNRYLPRPLFMHLVTKERSE
jgi:hypothetical protein